MGQHSTAFTQPNLLLQHATSLSLKPYLEDIFPAGRQGSSFSRHSMSIFLPFGAAEENCALESHSFQRTFPLSFWCSFASWKIGSVTLQSDGKPLFSFPSISEYYLGIIIIFFISIHLRTVFRNILVLFSFPFISEQYLGIITIIFIFIHLRTVFRNYYYYFHFHPSRISI